MKSISERGKHRLRIAARFLRQSGQRFEGDNFYSMVIKSISKLNPEEQDRLRSLADWLEEYEQTELKLYGEPPQRSRARKINPKSSKGEYRASGASVTYIENHEVIKVRDENGN